jgi:hypothetical protein
MIPRPEISAWRRDSLDETIEAKRLLRTYATLAAQQLELSLIELKAPDRGGDRDGIFGRFFLADAPRDLGEARGEKIKEPDGLVNK